MQTDKSDSKVKKKQCLVHDNTMHELILKHVTRYLVYHA